MVRTLKSVVFYQGTMYRPYDVIPDEVAENIGEHAWTEDETEIDTRNGPSGLTDTVIVPRESGAHFNRPEAPQQDPATPDLDEGDGTDDDGDDERESGEGVQPSPEPPVPPASGNALKAPPRSGKGSGLDAWRAHASALGVDVDDSDDRDDIMAAVDAHHLTARAAGK